MAVKKKTGFKGTDKKGWNLEGGGNIKQGDNFTRRVQKKEGF